MTQIYLFSTRVLQGIVIAIFAILALASTARSQVDFFSTVEVDSRDSSSSNFDNYSLIGWVTQKASYSLEDAGAKFSRREKEFNKIETSLFSQLDGGLGEQLNFRVSGKIFHDEIYRFNSGSNYSRDERDEFRNRFELRDFYLERQYDNGTYLKIGNQILAWGLSEYLRVTDLVNIENQYTLGQQDLEDLRRQVPAALLSFTKGDWTFDSAFTYRAGRNQMAPAGDEFDQLINQRNLGATLRRKDPDTEFESFFRASTHLTQGDLQIVAGEFNDNAISVDQLSALQALNPHITYMQNRMRAVGLAANWVEGSWLLFGELGMHLDKAVRPTKDSFFTQLNGWEQKDQVLSVIGAEYNGFRNLLLSVEIDSIHTPRHDTFMAADRNQVSLGSRLYWTALNERLQVLAVWNQLANDAGSVSRLSVDYNWSDNLDLGLMWVDYSSEENSIFYNFRNNDVFQLHLKYNFQI